MHLREFWKIIWNICDNWVIRVLRNRQIATFPPITTPSLIGMSKTNLQCNFRECNILMAKGNNADDSKILVVVSTRDVGQLEFFFVSYATLRREPLGPTRGNTGCFSRNEVLSWTVPWTLPDTWRATQLCTEDSPRGDNRNSFLTYLYSQLTLSLTCLAAGA